MLSSWKVGCKSCTHLFDEVGSVSDLKSEKCPNCGSKGPHLVGTEYGLEMLGYSDQMDGFNFRFQPAEGGHAP